MLKVIPTSNRMHVIIAYKVFITPKNRSSQFLKKIKHQDWLIKLESNTTVIIKKVI